MPLPIPSVRRPARALLVLGLAGVLVAGLLATVGAAADQIQSQAQTQARTKGLRISVLSNRADLVSGGNALVRVNVPRRLARQTRVLLNGRDVTHRFALRRNGRYEGLLRGMRLGRNRVRVVAPGYAGGRVLVNYRNGGPIFSGPQHRPYVCQAEAKDRWCNQKARRTLLYKSTDPNEPELKPYDRKNPPSDVAMTTTDQGRTVPFIVRREDGFQARDRYSILTLFRPGRPWKPWAPQRQWNRKVLVTHGGNCGASYTPGSPRLEDYAGTLPPSPGVTQSFMTALGRGFAVAAAALNNTGHNCNVAVEAEAMMMLKERLVERYGPIRYTIGTGCSGGAIAQHTIANTYPGIYQGLVTTCSYPDALTAGAQFFDYHLLRLYFEDPSRWAPGVVWTPTQMAAVEGHLSHVNAVVADEGLFKAALDPENPCPGTKDPVAGDRRTRFDSEINPGGVRCSVLDIMRNLLGPRPRSEWTRWEVAAGRSFAGIPLSNVGVQYGLQALKDGQITPAQFADLNDKIGGLDINRDFVPQRLEGDPTAIARAYRTGVVNLATNLDEVAMINHGGPDPGAAHDYSHAYWTEYRLQRDQGHTGNRVMWFGPTPLIGDVNWANEAFLAMDRWLTRVEKDRRRLPLARKIVLDRPADVTDRCVSGAPGVSTGTDGACEIDALQTNLGTPRQVAGQAPTNDILACQLRAWTAADYGPAGALFTPDQVATLQRVFAPGVCDWRKPGQGQGPALTWLSYGTARKVTYGGTPLPPPPRSSGTGWFGRSFREQLRR